MRLRRRLIAFLRTTSIRWRVVLFFLVSTALGGLSMAHLVEPDRLAAAYIGLTASMAASLAVGWLLASSITAPLGELQEKVDGLRRGEDDQLLCDRAGDEFSLVYESLNSYVLKRDHEELRRLEPEELEGGTAPREARARVKEAALEALLEAACELEIVYDFTDGAGRLLAACNSCLRIEAASVCLLDASKARLELAASAGLSEDLSQELALHGPRPVAISPGEGPSGQVILKGLPLVLNRGDRDPQLKGLAPLLPARQRVRSFCCLPVTAAGEVIGIASFANVASPAGFGELELELLRRAADLLARLCLKVRRPQEAFREAVSGLHHHDFWRGRFGLECQRFRRHPSKLSLVKLSCELIEKGMDLAEQNGVLAAIGKTVREGLREEDGATRTHSSFYVYLPDTDALGALFIAGRLKDQIDALGTLQTDGSVRFVVAAGVASCPEHVADPEALIQACDEAVAASLRAGDHRLVIGSRGGGEVGSRGVGASGR